MTLNDDFIAQLEDYFETFDGATPLPDRVRDAIRAELPTARQVRPRPGVLRSFTMLSNTSAGARLGVAAAAVIVAAVLGATFLSNRQTGPGVTPATPFPTTTTSPSAPPTPSASAVASGPAQPLTLRGAPFAACDATDTKADTCMAPGTYQLNNGSGTQTWPVMVTVDVPAGWFDWDVGPGVDGLLVDGGAEARGGSGWGALFATVGAVSVDPCDAAKGVLPAAPVDTPGELAAVMASWPGFSATAPQPITVDGDDGVQVRLSSTSPSACAATGRLWTTRAGVAVDAYPMIGSGAGGRAPGTFRIVDTGNGLLVIRTTDFPQTSPNELGSGVPMDPTRHAGDQTELRAILDSIRLTPIRG
ncbi:MAG TPA: hypothetical protein VFI34_06935 [Candidatus Limnocylindrales bacterium]|nr:hypothetical protein [Candidatus Limnocylindrales bacterium]